MNRCFPVGYNREPSKRNYNGTGPLQAYEAQALRDFILSNTGSQNIVIDVHGWLNETIGDNDLGAYIFIPIKFNTVTIIIRIPIIFLFFICTSPIIFS